MSIKAQRGASLAFSLLGVAGVVGTFISVSKEAPKAKANFEALPKDCKKSDKIKTFIKSYKFSLLISTAAIASEIGSKILSNKVETSLIATATMLDAGYRKYRNTIKKTLGIDADKSVLKQVMKDDYKKPTTEAKEDELLYWEEHIGYFYATKANILKAYAVMNEDISGANTYYVTGRDNPGWITIKEFLNLCEGRPLSRNLNDNKLNFGWQVNYLSEFWEYWWIHMDISEPDENGAHMIYWFEEPVWNPAYWYDYTHSDMTREEYLQNFEGDASKVLDDNLLYKKDDKLYEYKNF